ncbi:VENN motif pre-toxin domain-containing protein [Actinobacillus equuli subsp. equuli]|uniref:VENN motif pre-toxin domain-containing protein n=1 Tax=Actinobacillus equuli TaxID=718 RepID=UPI0024428D72|nr:VENN motif pre-toxin domain-containing protein [Actinobacillus equuli]WGE54252.1 VENN motif pre-toxin domain-containing protein [Actinobacillus equuli subsp. equuli]
MGSHLQMGVRAATAALQGLATGRVESAAVGAASPYLNKLIKAQNGDNKEANLIAHAVLGAVEAHVTGNNAVAGAVGALTAEAAAPEIMKVLYNTDEPESLTDSQKRNVANLSQIAAGLAGGLTGDSMASGVVGAEIGKRAVENNHFADDIYPTEEREQTIEMMAKAMFNGDKQKAETYYEQHEKEVKKLQLQEYLAIFLTKGIPQVTAGSTIVAGSFSGGSELVGQLLENNGEISKVDKTKIGISTVTGMVTKDTGLLKVALTNSGVEVVDSFRTNENAWVKGGTSFGATLAGGYSGKIFESQLDNIINPVWKIKYSDKSGHLPYGISESYKPSYTPLAIGNAVDNGLSKILEKPLEDYLKSIKGDTDEK